MCWCIIPLGCSFNLIIKCMLFYYALFYEQLFILLNLKMLYRNESLTKLTSGCQYIAFSWNHSISFLCSSKLGNSSTFSRETGTSDVFPFLNLIVALIVAEDPFKFWTDQSLTLSNFSGLCKNIGSPIFGMILAFILFPFRWRFDLYFSMLLDICLALKSVEWQKLSWIIYDIFLIPGKELLIRGGPSSDWQLVLIKL